MNKQAHTLLFWFVVVAIALALSAGVQQALAVQTETKITPATPVPDHTFGSSVDIDGTTAVVGAPNGAFQAVYVFEYDGTNWVEQQQLIPGGTIGFGVAVALSGDTLLVGDSGHSHGGFDQAGSVYIFRRDQSTGTWILFHLITEPVPGTLHRFGGSVDIHGDYFVVGAKGDDLLDTPGSAYVYKQSPSGSWDLHSTLSASDGMADDFFGRSVAIDGMTIVIGAPGHDIDVGAVYAFEPDTTNPLLWTETAKLMTNYINFHGELGSSVDVSGDRIVAGAPSFGITDGLAIVYERTQTSGWSQTNAFSSAATSDLFGASVAIDGDTILVGAPSESGGGYNSGNVTAYTFNGSTWAGVSLAASDEGPDDRFGEAVALYNDRAIVGAPHNDFGSGETGAAYIYDNLLDFPLPFANFFLKIICCVPVPPDPIGPVTYGMKYFNLTDETLTILRWAELTKPNGEVVEILSLGPIDLAPNGRFKERQTFQLVSEDPSGEYLLTVFWDDGYPRSETVAFEKLAREGISEPNGGTNRLEANHPNPFNPTTEIGFRIAETGYVSLRVYDLLGREVATLVDEQSHPAGEFSILFDASQFASGLYFYSLQMPGFSAIRKMMLIK